MSDAPVHNPHDAFFKQTFGRSEFAREFLAEFLPRDVAAYLELSALAATGDSYVDDELRQAQSDLVYTVPLVGGGEALVYLLFEHKSHVDRLTVFQMLKYVVRINERRLREGMPLCCVIPLVVYHGPGGWNAALSFEELVRVPPALKRFLPRFSIELFDLSRFDDDELRGSAFYHASLLLLKYILRPELPGELTRIFGLLADIQKQPQGLECIKLLLNYVLQGTDRVDHETLRGALQQSLSGKGETLMPTLAEKWENEGIEKGIRQGIEQGIEKGIEQGIEKGELIGGIRSLQEALSDDVRSKEELLQLDTPTLRTILDDLRQRLRSRL